MVTTSARSNATANATLVIRFATRRPPSWAHSVLALVEDDEIEYGWFSDTTTTIILYYSALHMPLRIREILAILDQDRGTNEATQGTFVETNHGTQSVFLAERGGPMSFTLGDNQFIDLTVSYVDAKGNAASIDGDVAWVSSDDTVVKVSFPDAKNTMVARLTAGKVGSAQVTATANADMDKAGAVRDVVVTGTVNVIGGEAVSGSFAPGTAQPQV